MKKVISLILAVVMLSSFAFTIPAVAETVAEGTCGDSLTWTLDGEGVLTVSGTGEMDDFSSWSNPPSWDDYCDSIKKVVIGEGVTSVGSYAFWGYDYLSEVQLPSTLKAINSSAFSACNALTEVTIPPSVDFIDFAFPYDIVIKGYKYTGAEVFADIIDTTFISLGEVPEAVVCEGSCGDAAAFSLTNRGVLTVSGTGETPYYDYEESPWAKYMYWIRKVVIEEGITAIGEGTFNGGRNIAEIILPEGLTSIGNMAFYCCNEVTAIELPSTLVTVGDSAFDSWLVEELVIPEGVTTIGEYAFASENMTQVTVPKSVTSIGADAFNFEPSNCTIIGEKGSYAEEYAAEYGYMFTRQVSAVSGTIGESISWVLDEKGILKISGNGKIASWGSDYKSPWYEYRDSIVEVIVEDGITYLGGYCFWYNTVLESVTIPESVEYIDFYFIWNQSLNIKIKGLTYSDAYAYADSRGFEFVSLGNAARKEIANGTCGDATAWTLDNYGTLTISGNGPITDRYGWYDYRSNITEVIIQDGVTSICSDAFTSCTGMQSITIPVSVMTIDTYAFSGIAAVVKGYSPSVAKTFAEEQGYTFESLGEAPLTVVASGECGDNITWSLDNYGLLKIEGTGPMSYPSEDGGYDNGVEVGGAEAVLMSVSSSDVPWYSYRDMILEVEISEGITSIEAYAFYNCDKLVEVDLPISIVSVGESAFASCSALEKVSVYYNVTAIGYEAFSYSYNLVLYGYTGSVAETYATENYVDFISVGEAPVVDVADGDLTETIKWGLNNYGVLTIYGTGDMPAYDSVEQRPWSNYSEYINKVEIKDVNLVTKNTLTDCQRVKEIVLDGVVKVEDYAFDSCRNIEKVTMSPSVKSVYRYSFGYSQSQIEYIGYRGTYAENYAEFFEATFTPVSDGVERKTVYVSTVDELVEAIDSDTVIIIEDGVYLLDRSSYLGNKEYTWEYADVIRIKDVSNLTIMARNPGKVEILAAQLELKNNYSYENSIFYIEGGYNILIDGIRFGNLNMTTNDYRDVEKDDVELMGGYDETGLGNYGGSYITSLYTGNYNEIVLGNKVEFRNCDIFNCANGILFYGRELKVINCTIRDTLSRAMTVSAGAAIIKNSVFSHNGCSTNFKGTYCIDAPGEQYDCKVYDCTFINNQNPNYISREVSESGNVFANNAWDGQSAKAYGVTHNGITWQISDDTGEKVLKLGYEIAGDGASLTSSTGNVYSYTIASLPWRDFEIDTVDVAEGIVYNYVPNGACGANIAWHYDESTDTLTLSGKGDMSDMGYMEVWENLNIENIVIDKAITGVYNLFSSTAYAQNQENWENGVLYIDDVLVRVNTDTVGEIKIKEGTRLIAEEAFHNCRQVTSIVVPEGVTSVGVTQKLAPGESAYYGAFSACEALTKLTLPASLKVFDHAMVYNCNSLTDIHYAGTTVQWYNIEIGSRNDQLDFCTIHTADGDILPPAYFYTSDETGVTITSINPAAESVTIPAEVDSLPVVKITDGIFVGNSKVKEVVIEANVEIAPAFENCVNLESIVLGEGIKYIFYNTFEGCEKLNAITLGDSVEEMSSKAFESTAYYNDAKNWDGGILYVCGYAAALSPTATGKVTVRSDAKSVCYDTFNNNSTVTEVVIPDGVKIQRLGENFYNMSSLEKITVPDTFTANENGFGVYECEKLVNIEISVNNPDYVSVDGVVFNKDMTKLEYFPMGRTGSYTIPDGVNEIASGAFVGTHLSSLTIPGSVNKISDGAFSYSYYLTDVYYNITIAQWEDLESIYIGYSNQAFESASLHLLDYEFIQETLDYMLSGDGTYYIVTSCKDYVTSATIPAEYKSLPVTEVDSYAFFNKKLLTEINAEEESAYFTSVDGVVFTKDMKTLVAYPAGKAGESYSLPEGVTAIKAQAFAYSENLKSVDLGDELTAIGMWAFQNSGITSVTIPETVSVITRGAFATMSLEKASFGTHITAIERNAFYNGLKYIYFDGTLNEWRNVSGQNYIPSETEVVTKIEIYAYAHKGEEEIMVEMAVDGLSSSQSLIMIGMDGEGTHVTYDECYGEELYAGPVTIEGEKEEIKKVEKVKIFVWESLESMRPLGDPIVVEVN